MKKKWADIRKIGSLEGDTIFTQVGTGSPEREYLKVINWFVYDHFKL